MSGLTPIALILWGVPPSPRLSLLSPKPSAEEVGSMEYTPWSGLYQVEAMAKMLLVKRMARWKWMNDLNQWGWAFYIPTPPSPPGKSGLIPSSVNVCETRDAVHR